MKLFTPTSTDSVADKKRTDKSKPVSDQQAYLNLLAAVFMTDIDELPKNVRVRSEDISHAA